MKNILIAAVMSSIVAAILSAAGSAHSATLYGGGSLLQTGDVKSEHILNGTIKDIDISSSAAIAYTKVSVPVSTWYALIGYAGRIGWSNRVYFDEGANKAVFSNMSVHASSTNFNGVAYTWPSTQGSAGQVLQNDGSGGLSWVAGAGTYTVATFTAGESIAQNEPVYVEDASTEDSVTLTTVTSTVHDGNNAFGVTTTDAMHRMGTRAAQGINEASAKTVDKLVVYIAKAGAPADTVQVAIQANAAGQPSGTDIAYGTVSGSSLTTTAAPYTITLNTRVTLSASTQYWVVYKRSGATDNTNYYRLGGLVYTSQYSGGALYYYEGGSSWLASTDGVDAHVDLLESTITGRVYRTSGTLAAYATSFIGFARSAAAKGASVDVTTGGLQTTFTGLSTGTPYYLANATGTISTSAGTFSRKACMAVSASSCIVTNIW